MKRTQAAEARWLGWQTSVSHRRGAGTLRMRILQSCWALRRQVGNSQHELCRN